MLPQQEDRDAFAARVKVGVMISTERLKAEFLGPAMLGYFRRRLNLPEEDLEIRLEEALKFLFIANECSGAIPVSQEIDEVWHLWILETEEYMCLCERLPARAYIHHSSNDYVRFFDDAVDSRADLRNDVKMLALYVTNFGPLELRRARYWLLAAHLVHRRGWSIRQVNEWLQPEAAGYDA
jgi:hypothetical protein